MTNNSSENAALIYNLQTLHREIPIEANKPDGEKQLATMIRLFRADIPMYIEKLRRLEELENEASRIARTYTLRVVPD